jgi:hypothetical protein
MNKIKYIVPVLIAIACLGLQQAKADTFVFNLTSPNAAVSGFPAPYVLVQITTNGTNVASISFNSLQGGGNIYLMGGAQGIGLNTSAAATVGNFGFLQIGQTGFSAPSVNGTGPGNVDGFGSFTNTVDFFNGFDHAFNQVVFTLTRTTGVWGAANTVLTANAQGAFAAAHIFVTAAPANQANGALATGFVANGGAVSTPDGGMTVMLLGAALGALGMARRFLKA